MGGGRGLRRNLSPPAKTDYNVRMSVTLLIALHSHQPVGNFDSVFRRAFRDCYAPLLEMLSAHPHIRLAYHHSGCLLEWIEKHEPAYLDQLRRLVEAGQIEVLGGGFFEPILPAIPERDAEAQLRLFSDYLEKRLGQRPAGFWLTERVWDPSLPRVLRGLDLSYTLVDDAHFRYAGFRPEEIWGHFLTEREGRTLNIFPIDQTLRYLIPFREPEETLDYLRRRGEATPGFVATYGDDGEKFGVWPETHEWVFGKGWLQRFFHRLEQNRDWLKLLTFREHLQQTPARGRVYLPLASYEEMMEWSLPAEMIPAFENLVQELKAQNRWAELMPFVRGGQWANFLAKYPEANLMHKRMLRVSDKLEQARAKRRLEPARRHLFRGQCNCAYWHGVFGGLYLNYLRHAVYEQLIAADRMIEDAGRGPGDWLNCEQTDLDCDGAPELLVESARLSAYFHPRQGGGLFALEFRPKNFSVSNVLGRRREGYHAKLAQATAAEAAAGHKSIHETVKTKEPGLEKYLVYDRLPRFSFLEHFLPDGLTRAEFQEERFAETGDFAGRPYLLSRCEFRPMAGKFTLAREAKVWSAGRESLVRLEKTFSFAKNRNGLSADYQLTNLGESPIPVSFGIEFNLTLLAGQAEDRFYRLNGEIPSPGHLAGAGESAGVAQVELVDQAFGFVIYITLSPQARLWRFPVETVSLSEGGFERTYQGSCLLLWRPLELRPHTPAPWEIKLDFRELPPLPG